MLDKAAACVAGGRVVTTRQGGGRHDTAKLQLRTDRCEHCAALTMFSPLPPSAAAQRGGQHRVFGWDLEQAYRTQANAEWRTRPPLRHSPKQNTALPNRLLTGVLEHTLVGVGLRTGCNSGAPGQLAHPAHTGRFQGAQKTGSARQACRQGSLLPPACFPG